MACEIKRLVFAYGELCMTLTELSGAVWHCWRSLLQQVGRPWRRAVSRRHRLMEVDDMRDAGIWTGYGHLSHPVGSWSPW